MAVHFSGDPAVQTSLDTFVKLCRATETVNGILHRELAAIGLTTSQFGALEAIYHRGPMCQKELGFKLLKSGANITTVVNNLEKRGLLERIRRSDDRRYVTVDLTDEGRTLISEVFPSHALRIRTVLNTALTLEEIAELGELCRKLGVTLSELETV